MKRYYSRAIIVALLSGISQYYLLVILLGCIYPAVPQSTSFVIFTLITFAITITTKTLFSQKQTFTQGVFCFIIMLIALAGATIINAYSGTIIRLQQLLNIPTSTSSDNATGMLTLLYITAVVVVGVITLLILGLKNLYIISKQKSENSL